MNKKPNWDDIPSLKLGVDDTAEKTSEKRTAVRLVSRDILKLVMDDAEAIYVKAANSQGVIKNVGILRDINQNGMCFKMSSHGLQVDDSIRIRTLLGKRAFQTNANVRWVGKDRAGVEYVNPEPKDVKFLSELYAAKILNRV
ncbi:MAG: PilZ domain-containing protein [Thermodesulfobacteriota bacterium]|nr:PilZ domain-containing protein [Thermodesulfobacteriota bacterium]